jgi:acetyl-CoA carboxylase biotin carboxyl carrier protein
VSLTAKDVAEITRLLEESCFDELHLETDGWKLSLRRAGAALAEPAASSLPPAASPAPAVARAPASAGDGAHLVPAPMLGTFYRAPKPGAAPYVEIGSVVEADSIIGIIEVMKLMNVVRAGVRGTVVEILGRDGELVEFGETLLRVAKTS